MKKSIFCDLDGTLLNSASRITDYSKIYIQNIVKDGNEFFIVTGRSFESAYPFYLELGLNNHLICDNGGYIFNPHLNSELETNRLPSPVFHEFFYDIKSSLKTALFNIHKSLYSYKYEPNFDLLVNGILSNVIEYDPSKETRTPNSIIALVYNHKLDYVLSLVKNKYSHVFNTRIWGNDYKYTILEVYYQFSHKEAAYRKIIDFYQIDEENTICFGDGLNDYEFIKDSFFGVAMINAKPEILKIAKDTTKESNNNDGVIKYLEKFINS